MHLSKRNNTYAFNPRFLICVTALFLTMGLSGCQTGALPGNDSLNTTIKNTPTVVYKPPKEKPLDLPGKLGITPKKDMLSCKIHSGTVRFEENWYNFKPAEARVLLGNEGGFILERTYGDDKRLMYIRYEPSGQKVVICPTPDDPDFSGEIECTGIYALEQDFIEGIHRTLDVPDAIRGGKIKCQISK